MLDPLAASPDQLVAKVTIVSDYQSLAKRVLILRRLLCQRSR
jgi:hypothetical protein